MKLEVKAKDQSYQNVTLEILKELPVKGNIQNYFFKLKEKYPDRFQRLMFDTNGGKPFSEDLEDILFDLKFGSISVPCGGYRDEWNGDFDCDHLNPPDCEDCVVNYKKTGGRINPITGKIFKNDKGSTLQKRKI